MNLPAASDFLVFGRWDGVLVALWILVMGVVLRFSSRVLRQKLPDDPSLTVSFNLGTSMMVVGALAVMAAWVWLPPHGPDVWGAVAIALIALAYVYGARSLRGSL